MTNPRSSDEIGGTCRTAAAAKLAARLLVCLGGFCLLAAFTPGGYSRVAVSGLATIAFAALLVLVRRQRESAAPVERPEEAPKPALLDPLTGLANERYLSMFLQQEISRSERSGQPMTVLLIDIDDFDRLNGTAGTDAGDQCITALGTSLRRMIRDYDLVARYKDDEFVVVLPEASATAGSETARRLHCALSGHILPSRARFSVGVATYPTHGTSVDDLLSSAHHALNRAKFSGKNTVRSCHELAKAS